MKFSFLHQLFTWEGQKLSPGIKGSHKYLQHIDIKLNDVLLSRTGYTRGNRAEDWFQ